MKIFGHCWWRENCAFVDAQNLYRGTTSSAKPWKVDTFKFYRYLQEKYQVAEVYYFMGRYDTKQANLYKSLNDAGYKLVFRKHFGGSRSAKKGNVDTDIVFMMMREYCERKRLGKIYLVSGDGDYYRTVEFLVQRGKFGKVLFPSRRNASALYKKIAQKHRAYLDDREVKRKIIYN